MNDDRNSAPPHYFEPLDLLVTPTAVRVLWCRRIDTTVLDRPFKPGMTPQEMMEAREALVAAVDYLSFPCFPDETNWREHQFNDPRRDCVYIEEDLHRIHVCMVELMQLICCRATFQRQICAGAVLARHAGQTRVTARVSDLLNEIQIKGRSSDMKGGGARRLRPLGREVKAAICAAAAPRTTCATPSVLPIYGFHCSPIACA